MPDCRSSILPIPVYRDGRDKARLGAVYFLGFPAIVGGPVGVVPRSNPFRQIA